MGGGYKINTVFIWLNWLVNGLGIVQKAVPLVW